ncbi:imidazolonepropionase-like amidohydrolase [Pontibacter mucosus]|uniref:Imidazolonepropionase-like amidohydrolase n=1 Tax=Pontibacter mucosus TaxID=1649266 RepID=A0A2T5YGS3_9BACT|nr:imidazolonepropionase-like amidohydrolase [Pontibacter mucosus]
MQPTLRSFLLNLIFSCLFILSASMAQAQEAVNSANRDIVFRAVHVVPMDKEQVLQNQDVVVRDGKITAMGSTGKVKYGKGALVIDAKGKYLMPGLAEMHAHVPPVDDLEPMKEVVRLFALKGVTTIRGMLGHPRHLELRSMIEKGELLSPRFYTSGPSFNGGSVKSPEQGAEMVRQQKQAGYDFLKLHPGLTPETFGAIAKAAKAEDIPYAGHVSYDVGVWRAIEAGYATIDHLDGFVESLIPNLESIPEQETGLFAMFISDQADASRIPKLVSALRENNIWVVPTQALAERWIAADKAPEVLRKSPEMVYMSPNILENWVASKQKFMANPKYDPAAIDRYMQLRRKLIYECQKNGVGLLLGSDAPQVFNVPGFSTHQELEYLVAAGLTPYEALQTGTVNVGKFYNRPDLGVIKAGAVADLILVAGNPLENIRETQNIEGVLVGKQWLPKAYIDQELKKLEKR